MRNFLLVFLFVFISLPGFTQEEDESIDELIENREERLESVQNLQETTDQLSSAVELQEMLNKDSSFSTFTDKKFLKLVSDLFAQGVFQKEPREATRANLEEKLNSSKIGALFKRFPVLVDIATDVLRDKEAFPGLIKILGMKKELNRYLVTWIAIMLFSFLFRRAWLRPRIRKKNFFYRNFASLFVSVFISSMTLIIFYLTFKSELTPTVEIIKNYL